MVKFPEKLVGLGQGEMDFLKNKRGRCGIDFGKSVGLMGEYILSMEGHIFNIL